ncbi:MAG TPA: PQQ-binding-like beta-propeller repeat protein, partial [Gemmatimonadaceae bacterium]|nr:PQQ-binding-like beta-propeller repeat protein [Gemmatimonadaceae bacterium]
MPLPIDARMWKRAIFLCIASTCIACAPEKERAATSRVPAEAQPQASGAPRATAALEPEDGQWIRPAKSYSSLRYSQLTEITRANVGQLKQAWSYSTGVLRGHEEPPIVVNNTMYIVTPFPNELHALDLARSGAAKWVYRPRPEAAAQGVACCDVVNRGVVYDNGRLFFNTLDNNVVAVDANSGREVWKTKVGEINLGETMTMAPLVVKGLVLVGNSGGEMGVRGWLKALDAASGAVRWTAYSTGPDKDVLIGPRFKPFYDDHKGKDLGTQSWPGDSWSVGG